METLKLKIFDVLTKRTTIFEFESWLYESDYLKDKIKGDSLIFSVININYKHEDAINKLKEIAFGFFSEEELLANKIEKYCLKIINSNDTNSYKKYVLKIIENFDFDIDFEAYWDFYSVYHSFGGYDLCEYENTSLKHADFKTKQIAKSVIEKLTTAKNIKEKVIILQQKTEIIKENNPIHSFTIKEKTEKLTLKQKIFAFFKKI